MIENDHDLEKLNLCNPLDNPLIHTKDIVDR
jgi:hypothetical protein